MGYAIMRFQKYNDVKKINNAIRHCQRDFPMSTLTNPDARNIIVYTRPMLDAGYDKKSFEEVLSEKLQGNKIRKNNVLCLEYIMSFSKGTIPEDKHDDWIKTSVKWLQDFYGPTNIYKIYVHNDESNTHIHAFCMPIRDNHLCFKKFIDGPKDCKLHQDSYYEAVKHYGLDRGLTSTVTKNKHESHKHWMAANAEKEATLTAYKETFGNILDWDIDTIETYYKNYDRIKNAEETKEKLAEETLYFKTPEPNTYAIS